VLSIAKFGATGMPGGQASLILASAALGLAGAFADLAVPTPAWTLRKKIFGVPVPPFHLDDNFVVPIFSGFACTKILEYVGWSQSLALSKFLLV
jgi:dolichol kinase